MSGKLVIGIDPGKHGGIAAVCSGGEVVDVVQMPDTAQDILLTLREFVSSFVRDGGDVVCYVEKVGGIPGQGASSAFNFGRGCGHLEMCLLALEVRTVYVTPQRWQKMYGVGSSSITRSTAAEKRDHKNALKAVAQRLYPSLGRRVTLQTCDALLIANYGLKEEAR